MSETKYESEIKHIDHSCSAVYKQLSDLNNLDKLKKILDDPEKKQALKEKVPADKAEQIEKTLKEMKFDTDSVNFNVSMLGNLGLRIIEREEPKLIKFVSEGAPIEANLWIQIVPEGDAACKIKVTAGAHLNMFIKGMVDKYASTGVNNIANILASLPYDEM